MWEGLQVGAATAFTATNMMLLLAGCLTGTLIGLLPGLGPISAIALMIPVTYGMDPAGGLIMLAGVYYGAIFGGSTSSILINAPGVAGTVATSFDGHPLAKRGLAGKALALAAYASFSGGALAAVLLLFAAPALAKLTLGFHSSDYFALMVLGLTSVSAFAGGDMLKAIAMTIVGLMLATVGTDLTSGVPRFTFGSVDLLDGLGFLLVAMATFALAEALMSVLKPVASASSQLERTPGVSSLRISRQELRQVAPTVGRSSLLGFVVGVLPGAGATIASFLAYGFERQLSRGAQQQEFGKGSLRGLAAPEAANNAACTGSFVPLLTLGIPGSGTTAVLLGALISYGVQPGPRLLLDHPGVFWSVIVSMYLGNLVLLILNLPLVPLIARLLAVPRELLVPMVLFFSLIGVYLVSFNYMDFYLMVGLAVVAVALRLLGFTMAPLLLGFVLGRPLENNLRRALALNDGSPSFLWERPLTATILAIALAVLAYSSLRALRRRGKHATDGPTKLVL